MAKKESSFVFSDLELSILKNFSQVNPSMVINPTHIGAVNKPINSVVCRYDFEKPYGFEPFGVFEVPELLTILNTLKKPSIDVREQLLEIVDGDSKTRYFTTAKNLIPEVPDVEKNFAKITPELDFDLPGDKLATLLKMAGIIKAQFAFFETDGKKVRITVGNELESSSNTFNVTVDSGIRTNSSEKVLRIPLTDLKLIPGGYEIRIASAGVSKWTADCGAVYFIGAKAL